MALGYCPSEECLVQAMMVTPELAQVVWVGEVPSVKENQSVGSLWWSLFTQTPP